MMNATERTHVEHGASSAERWMSCPGSVRLCRGQPNRSTPESREGTAAHELAAAWLSRYPAVPTPAEIVVEGEPIEVTDEMRAAVQDYVGEVVGRLLDLDGDTRLLVEEPIDLESLRPPVPMRGTADAIVYRAGALDVIDFKYGKGVAVDATENVQAMYYALGAVLALKKRPRTIRVTIVQPRAFHPAGPIRSYTFGWERLLGFKDELFGAVEATLEPNAPLVPGEHCRFCPARPVCPAQRAMALEVAKNEFEAQPLPAPAELTREEMLRALELAPAIEQWFGAIREFVRAELEAGRPVPGWKLVAKRATRKWVDERAAQEWSSAHGIEPWQTTLKSPAQIEAAVKAVYPARQRPTLPEALFEKVSSGNTLAPEADPRPAVPLLSAQDEFTALPQGETE